jgi:hypothetical protein
VKRFVYTYVILCNLIALVSFASVVESSTITTPVFAYDSNRQAVTIDMGQFPLHTEIHFVFSDAYPSQTQGGAIFWNQANGVNAGVFHGDINSRSYFAWDTSLNNSDAVADYDYIAVDPNNDIFGYVNNIRYFTDIWDYQSSLTNIHIQQAGVALNPIPVTESDFSNRFYYIAEMWDGGLSPTEWMQPHQAVIPIPGAVWLLGSGLIALVGLRKKFRK